MAVPLPRVPWPGVALAWAFVTSLPTAAIALPSGWSVFCATYADAPACRAPSADCTVCHTSAPPARNPYGAAIAAALAPGAPRPLGEAAYLAGLPAALAAVEALDSDGDGASNLDELRAGTRPSDAASRPRTGECVSDPALGWNVCGPDLGYALRRISLVACGRSPTRAERAALAADPEAALAAQLARCLDDEHWRGKDGVLWSLANPKIKPTRSIKSGVSPGDVPLADYEDDYNLFVYTQTDDRDARELLTASYHVERVDGAPTVYRAYTRTPAEDLRARSVQQAQNVPLERRAGMITTRWFLMTNTMFTAVPRTTAAQAYRAYLGLDIAKMEGLVPVANEPRDYDQKGVGAPDCARCHTTLDPLTYPFAYYTGIGGERPRTAPGAYVDNRPARFVRTEGASIANVPEAGVLFGRPVRDLREWASVAANSEAFARALVLDYWRLFVGADPAPNEQAELDALTRAFMTTHQYRVERLLAALVKTEAFRVP